MLTYTELSNEYVTNNEKQVKTFIKKHSSILDYVHELTPPINRYFPNNKKTIEFCKDPEFEDLDFMMIYIHTDSFDEDYETLNHLKEEPLYLSKFSKKINGLVCVELW